MLLRKLSSLLLIFLILNLNMVVPAVSYANAEETCSCHLESADHQCHCDKMHKHGEKSSKFENNQAPIIKGRTCSSSHTHDDAAVPALSIPFLLADHSFCIPVSQVSNLLNPIEKLLYEVSIAPAEKPPAC